MTDNVRERLVAMLRLPQADPTLDGLLAAYPRTLRFRVVVVRDREQRAAGVRLFVEPGHMHVEGS